MTIKFKNLSYLFFIAIMQFQISSVYADDSIQTFNNTMTIRTFAESLQLSLDIYHYDNEGNYSKSIYYSPSTGINAGIEFSYSTKVTETGYNLDNFERNDYGKTKQTDYQIYYYTRKHGIELFIIIATLSCCGTDSDSPSSYRDLIHRGRIRE